MSKSPAYQCYPKDFLSDLRCMALPNNQYGMYRKLIDIAWLENGLPDDPVLLARAVGEPVRTFTEKHWPVLRTFFDVRPDGRLTQKRQEEEREKQRRWREKSAEGGRKGAATRARVKGDHPSTTLSEPLEPNGNIPFPSPFPSPVSSGGLLSPPEPPRGGTAAPPARRRGGRAPTAPAKSGPTWDAYAEAYQARYGVEPKRNERVNALLCQLVDRLGVEAAPQVAAWYVGHPHRRYVEAGHAVWALVQDAEKLHTEWKTGRIVTTTQAQQADRRATTGQWAAELLAENAARRHQEDPDGRQ